MYIQYILRVIHTHTHAHARAHIHKIDVKGTKNQRRRDNDKR